MVSTCSDNLSHCGLRTKRTTVHDKLRSLYSPFPLCNDEFQEVPRRPIFAAPFDLIIQIWLANALPQKGQFDASETCQSTRLELVRDYLSISGYAWQPVSNPDNARAVSSVQPSMRRGAHTYLGRQVSSERVILGHEKIGRLEPDRGHRIGS